MPIIVALGNGGVKTLLNITPAKARFAQMQAVNLRFSQYVEPNFRDRFSEELLSSSVKLLTCSEELKK